MSAEEKMCFLDRERPCTDKCKAYTKTKECSVLQNGTQVANALSSILRLLNTPKIPGF